MAHAGADLICIHGIEAINHAPDPDLPEREVAYEACVMVASGAGAFSVALPDGRVLTVLVQDAADAEALAAARIARGASDLLAADCRPVAHAVADALVAAGLGRG